LLNDEGFLSSELKDIEDKFTIEFDLIFKFIRDVNKYFQACSFDIKIERSKIHQWFLAALYLRSLSTFQSIILLSAKGITGEAKVLLRSLIEIQYIIIAISKDNSLVNEYLGQEVVENEKILRKSTKWKEKYYGLISIKEVEEKLSELEQVKKTQRCKKFTIKDCAEKAGMLMDHEMNYSILSLTTHANVYEIKKHFIYDKDGILVSFNWGPNKTDIPNVLVLSTEVMFRIVSSIRDTFGLSINEKFDNFFNEFVSLRNTYIHI
jgi:hypothetical protein